MRPNSLDFIRGIKASLNQVIAPALPNIPFVQFELGILGNILDMLAAQWDTEAQRLIEERRGLTRHFQEAADVLRRLEAAGRKDGLADLATALAEAATQEETDFRLSALAERNNQLKGLLIRLMEVCDQAQEEPGLEPLLPIREAILHDLRAQLASYAFSPARAATQSSD